MGYGTTHAVAVRGLIEGAEREMGPGRIGRVGGLTDHRCLILSPPPPPRPQGATPLIIAAQGGHMGVGSIGHSTVVRALVAAGADVNQRAHDGRTATYMAATQGHVRGCHRLRDQ